MKAIFTEALNICAVWDLPVLFCVENNGYGLSTPTNEQYRCQDIVDKGIGYGIEAHIIDGNNIIEVYSRVSELVADIRKNPRPILLEFKTFRMRGHEEASGTKYVPQELMDAWALKDPLRNYQEFLLKEGILSESYDLELHEQIKAEIDTHLQLAFEEEAIDAHESNELNDVYHPFNYEEFTADSEKENIRLIDAISQGLRHL